MCQSSLHLSLSDVGAEGGGLTLSSFSRPLQYGRLSDLIGRKIILYIAIIIFVLGSALCGAAQVRGVSVSPLEVRRER